MILPINVRAEAGKPVWAPAGSLPKDYDWIQLTSGEWLKGNLKVLYADSLEFELTSRLDFDVSIVWDRNQDPEPNSDGIVPEQDDVYFFCGISFEL